MRRRCDTCNHMTRVHQGGSETSASEGGPVSFCVPSSGTCLATNRLYLRAVMTRNKKARQRKVQESAAQAAQATQARRAQKTALALEFVAAADAAVAAGDPHGALELLMSAYELDPHLEGLAEALHALYVRLRAEQADRARQPPPQQAETRHGGARGSFERQRQQARTGPGFHSGEETNTPLPGPAALLSLLAPHVLGVVLTLVGYKALWRALAGSFVSCLSLVFLGLIRPVNVANLVGAKWLVLSLLLCNPGQGWLPLWWCLLRSRSWAVPSTVLVMLAHASMGRPVDWLIACGATLVRGFFALLPVRWWITRAILRVALATFAIVLGMAMLGSDVNDESAQSEQAPGTPAEPRGDVVDEDVHGHGLSTAVPRGATDPEVLRILGCATWHTVLQVDASADAAAVRRAQRAKALVVHPDKNKDAHATRAFRRVMSALDVLSDDKKRRSYEAGLRQRGVLPPLR